MAAINVANNPIGSYPVKVSREGSGASTVNIQHVNVDSITNTALNPLYALGMGFDSINEVYRVIQVDASGNLIIGGSVTISGEVTIDKPSQGANSPATVTIGVTSGTVLNTNLNRTGAVFTNLSSNRICFGVGVAAVLDRGITLYPQGVWVMDAFTFSQSTITAIASSAGSVLAVQEFV